ncbi:LirA/MavJ family T4SS effector [Pseudomonas fluorescens]|uniref:DUF5636 domain-containing protein n=1 Tax=Pseudomonas fluorescens TaxID=294 RepID=A0A0D0PJF3_PSEFL|nr:LirA/MavJ family T4SS effector [Pseudomonas fluorescens]KIQ60657.1 hypothetical protein RL74_04325 [Pseudomonas fluorescens]
MEDDAMPAQNEASVALDFTQHFSLAFQNSDYYQDFCDVGALLSAEENCRGPLAYLEQQLFILFSERVMAAQGALRAKNIDITPDTLLDLFNHLSGMRKQWNRGTPAEFNELAEIAKKTTSKLLTTVLSRWEADNGFAVDKEFFSSKHLPADLLVGNVLSLFNDQLASGRPFKDLGAGPQHGEHTHRIQWYLIGIGLKLGPKAGAMFRNVKRWISRQPITSIDQSNTVRRYLWEYLFDREGDPSNAASVAFRCTDKLDFRAPSNLNRFLMDDTQRGTYPLLNWCLNYRFDKRTHQRAGIEYVSSKVSDRNVKKVANAYERQFVEPGDNRLLRAFNSGLFIRRGHLINGVKWQSWPDDL